MSKFMDYFRSPKGVMRSLAVFAVSDLIVVGALKHRNNDLYNEPTMINSYGIAEKADKYLNAREDEINSDFLKVAVPASIFGLAGIAGMAIGSTRKRKRD